MPAEYMCRYQNSTPCVGGYALRAPFYWPAIPPWTIRVKMDVHDETPIPYQAPGATVTRIFPGEDIYDITYQNANWNNLLNAVSYTDHRIAEVIGANTTGVTAMAGLFNEQDRLSNTVLFDTSAVTAMNGMYAECHVLESVPLYDTSHVTTMASMFRHCRSITELPEFDTSACTNFQYFCDGCGSLVTVPMMDTANVWRMDYAFRGCYSLHFIPLFDTSNVWYMDEMMAECSNLRAIPLFATGKVVSMNMAFDQCTLVESGALALYTQASTQTTPPANHEKTFRGTGWSTTTGHTELEQIPTSWGGLLT